MRTAAIPRTDLAPSSLCLGTPLFGSAIPRPDAFALMDAFTEAGGTFFDTARIYADWGPGERAASEKTIGAWLRDRGLQGRVLVATKGGHLDLATKQPRLSPAEIDQDLGESLTHLGLERIDLYWMHRDDPRRPAAEILETLEAQARAGRIRYYGCSNWSLPRIREADTAAREQGWTGFVANQPMWSLAKMAQQEIYDPTMVAMDGALHAYHRESGLAAIPFSSQAGGWFHKHSRAPGGAATKTSSAWASPENEARLRRVRQLAADSGLSITQIVLGYLTGQPFPTFPIIGCRTLEQLRDSLTAADIRLEPGLIRFLETGDPAPA